jgi:hypothetical protein
MYKSQGVSLLRRNKTKEHWMCTVIIGPFEVAELRVFLGLDQMFSCLSFVLFLFHPLHL